MVGRGKFSRRIAERRYARGHSGARIRLGSRRVEDMSAPGFDFFPRFEQNGLRARGRVLLAAFIAGAVLLTSRAAFGGDAKFTLRILDWKTGEVYASAPANPGDLLFFGWIHSLEKIPWNEYYHIDDSGRLILDAITFPAFGAGIPENKGKRCYVENGLIHMEEIGQVFEELAWLNSETATRDIRLGGKLIASGASLPHHARVRLVTGAPENP